MSDNTRPGRPEWLDLFRAFRMASDPVKVWLGFLGAAFTILMLVLALILALEVRQLTGGEISRNVLRLVREGNSAGAYQTLRTGLNHTAIDLGRDLADIRSCLFGGELMAALTRAYTLQKLLVGGGLLALLLWLPWSYFGGAISRAAVMEYATGERIPSIDAREFAAARFWSYWWAPVATALTVLALIVCGWLVGLAAAHLLAAVAGLVGLFLSLYLLVVVKQKTESSGRGLGAGLVGLGATLLLVWWLWGVQPGWLVWLAKIALVAVFPVLLALAVPTLFLAALLLLGRGLMLSAISYEGTDAFDAASRSGDYLLKRPWHVAFYTLVGAAYALPCLAVVIFFVLGGFLLASAVLWAGFGHPFASMYDAILTPGRAGSLAGLFPGFLFRVLFALVCGLVAGWGMAFLQSLRAISYALLRKHVDLCDQTEVYVDIDRLAAAPPDDEEEGGDDDTPPAQP